MSVLITGVIVRAPSFFTKFYYLVFGICRASSAEPRAGLLLLACKASTRFKLFLKCFHRCAESKKVEGMRELSQKDAIFGFLGRLAFSNSRYYIVSSRWPLPCRNRVTDSLLAKGLW